MAANLWLYLVTALTLSGTGVLVAAALSQSWYLVPCGGLDGGDGGRIRGNGGGKLGVGLYKACAIPNNASTRGESNNDSLCRKVDHVLRHGHIPAWLSGARILSGCGAASAGITGLLMLMFCLTPPHVALGSAHGLGGCGLGTAAFCVVSLLDAYVGRVELAALVDPVLCPPSSRPVTFSRGIQFMLSGALLTLISGLTSLIIRFIFGTLDIPSGDDDSSKGDEGPSTSASGGRDIKTKIRLRNVQTS